jgi:methyl-accepting chemotaxis protein
VDKSVRVRATLGRRPRTVLALDLGRIPTDAENANEGDCFVMRLRPGSTIVSAAVVAVVLAAGAPARATPPATPVADCVITIADLKVVSDDYAVHIVDTAHKVRAGRVAWADGARIVQAAHAQIRTRWTSYHQTRLEGRERAMADVASDLMRAADAGVAELLGILRDKRKTDLDTFVVDKLYPAIDPVTTAVSQLINQKILQCASSS